MNLDDELFGEGLEFAAESLKKRATSTIRDALMQDREEKEDAGIISPFSAGGSGKPVHRSGHDTLRSIVGDRLTAEVFRGVNENIEEIGDLIGFIPSPTVAGGVSDILNVIRQQAFPMGGGSVQELRESEEKHSMGDRSVAFSVVDSSDPSTATSVSDFTGGVSDFGPPISHIDIGEMTLDDDSSGIDLNGNGDIESVELAIAKSGVDISGQIALLHPLIAKQMRNPNFMRRKIRRAPISAESINHRSNQVNAVQQGVATFIENVNAFNVSF